MPVQMAAAPTAVPSVGVGVGLGVGVGVGVGMGVGVGRGGGGSRVAPLPLDETLSLDATPMLHRPAAAWRMAAVLPSPAAVSCALDETRILNAAESHGLRRSATACLPRVPPSSASPECLPDCLPDYVLVCVPRVPP